MTRKSTSHSQAKGRRHEEFPKSTCLLDRSWGKEGPTIFGLSSSKSKYVDFTVLCAKNKSRKSCWPLWIMMRLSQKVYVKYLHSILVIIDSPSFHRIIKSSKFSTSQKTLHILVSMYICSSYHAIRTNVSIRCIGNFLAYTVGLYIYVCSTRRMVEI